MNKRLTSYFVISFLLLTTFFSPPLSSAKNKSIHSDSGLSSLVLVDERAFGAGFSGRKHEYASLPTSKWTGMAANLQTGNHLLYAELFNLPGTPLPLLFTLTYNSLNAQIDVGLGKGWTSNLHAVVSENATTHDLTYIDGTGYKSFFAWDSVNSVYKNPSGFAGKMEKLQTGGYQISLLDAGKLVFDQTGNLIEIKDRCGQGRQTIQYDTSGRPTSLVDFLSGRAIYVTWNQAGKLSSVTDSMNHTWSFLFDSSFFLTEIIKPGSTTVKVKFGYDSASGRMTIHEDFKSNKYAISYYTKKEYAGFVKNWTQPDSIEATTDFVYEAITGFKLRTIVTDGEDHTYQYYFGNASQALDKMTMGVSGPTRYFEYNSKGFIISETDALGNKTTYAYDEGNHLTSILYPPPVSGGVSAVTEFIYDLPSSEGKLVKFREKVANTNPITWSETLYSYTDPDAPCKPSQIINPIQEVTTLSYDTNGLLLSVTKPTVPKGEPPVTTKTTFYTYDTANKALIRITDTEGNDSVFSYDSNGFPVRIIRYEGGYNAGQILQNREYFYDASNQLVSTIHSVTGKTAQFSWNENGFLISQTSEQGCQQSHVPANLSVVLLPGSPKGIALLNEAYSNRTGNLLVSALAVYKPNFSSFTDIDGHTSTFTLNKDGSLQTVTNHLSQTTTILYDIYDRVRSVTESDGKSVTYTYDANSRITGISSNTDGNTSFLYDNASRLVQTNSPIQGVIDYAYNIRGDKLSDEKGIYSYDLLGRKIGLLYYSGDSDTWSYDADGNLSGASGASFEYDKLGNVTRWMNEIADSADFLYNGTTGSTVMGLPSSVTGTGNISGYAMLWDVNGWLSTFTPSGKTGQYNYSWNSSKELSSMTIPNATSLIQTWSKKSLDSITVRYNQNDYLSTDSSFNLNDRLIEYSCTVMRDGTNTFSETSHMSYDSKGRLSQLSYLSANRVVSYTYKETNGLLDSLHFSDAGNYSIQYHALTGNISSVSYPNYTGTESFTYNGGSGRLSRIAFPENKNLNFIWNSKNQVTQVSYVDLGVITTYGFSYDFKGKLSGYTKTEGGIQTANWSFYYGPFGLEKAVRSTHPMITQDFTTDPTGRILSMTYTQEGGTANGEYYFHYDNAGNTVLLTDSMGVRQYAALYSLHNGKLAGEWNPNDLILINKGFGAQGLVTVALPNQIDLGVSDKMRIHLPYGSIRISETIIRINQEVTPEMTEDECKANCYKDCAIDQELLMKCLKFCKEKYCEEKK